MFYIRVYVHHHHHLVEYRYKNQELNKYYFRTERVHVPFLLYIIFYL
jgi:hypothetical protein